MKIKFNGNGFDLVYKGITAHTEYVDGNVIAHDMHLFEESDDLTDEEWQEIDASMDGLVAATRLIGREIRNHIRP